PGLRAAVQNANAGARPSMLPFEVKRDSTIVAAVTRAFRAVRGTDQPLGAVRPYCFYGTDAAHLLHRAKMERIVCWPGGRYNIMPGERVEVPDYIALIRMYLLTMREICQTA